jgi:hypothetical protein
LEAAHNSEPATKMPIAVRNTERALEAVGEPSADRDEDAEADHVGRDRDVQGDGLCPKSLAIAGSGDDDVASTLSMNNAQATMSGARKTGDMGRARGKGAIMPTLW